MQDFWTRDYILKIVTFSATPTFDCNAGNGGSLMQITLTANITSWTMPAGLTGQMATIIFKQDVTGSRTLAGTPSNVKLAGGALTLTTGANKVDVITFRYDGTNWREIARSLNEA